MTDKPKPRIVRVLSGEQTRQTKPARKRRGEMDQGGGTEKNPFIQQARYNLLSVMRGLLATMTTKEAREFRHRDKREQVGHDLILILTCFTDYVLISGINPPVEVAKFIARRFQRYLNAQGKLTLDDAFSLRSIQRAGSPAKSIARKIMVDSALTDIFMRMLIRKITRSQAIAEFLGDHADPVPQAGIESTRNTRNQSVKDFLASHLDPNLQGWNLARPGARVAWYGDIRLTQSVLEKEAKSAHGKTLFQVVSNSTKVRRKRGKSGR